MGHDAHLDLRVVRRHQGVVTLADNERLPDSATLLGAYRDVLQVRIGAGESSSGRDGLRVRGMDPAVISYRLEQALDSLLEPDRVPMHQKVRQEGVLGLD